MQIDEIFASYRKSGSRNTVVTSDFRQEVEIRPFRACTMKNTQYYPYIWPNYRNFRVPEKIGVEEHDGDVRFYTGSGNMAVSCMRHASGHNYIRTVCSLWTWLWGRYHVPQNVFLVVNSFVHANKVYVMPQLPTYGRDSHHTARQ